MKYKNPFIIVFKGLKNGKHNFRFEINSAFFEHFKISDCESGQAFLELELNKAESMMELDVSIKGTLQIMCDRCLEYFDFPLRFTGNLLVKFSEYEAESTDEILMLHPNDFELNLEHYVFESISLSIPYRKVHPDDARGEAGCNKEMLEKIEELSIEEEHEVQTTDPRWDLLKNISDNNN